jgi:hypothetical protein
MADNRRKYGFRFYASMAGVGRTSGIEGMVTSGYQGNVGSPATNVGVSIGDPVAMNAAGNFELAEDTAATSDRFFGVVVGIINARVDSNGKARPVSYLPGAVTWTNEVDRTRLIVLPFGRDLWEVDVDDNVTATTLAAYRALKGLNCEFRYRVDTTDANRPRADPVLDISTAATGANDFRIMDVSKTQENQDFSGANVKLIVQLGVGSEPMLGTTPVVGL